MRELSLNVLDIAQNSIAAGAALTEITVQEDTADDRIVITVKDTGRGMTPAQVRKVSDPLYTPRTTRKVGMGIPLFRMAADMAGGGLSIASAPGKGTTVTATFVRSHIDRMPLGDMTGTVVALIRMNPDRDFRYVRRYNDREFALDTRELREVLGDVPLDTPEVAAWISGYIEEQTQGILASPSGSGAEGAGINS